MILVHSDKKVLKSAILEIKDYLEKERGLQLHPKKIYLQHFKKGVCFLGAFVKPHRIYIGTPTKKNFYAMADEWNLTARKNRGLGDEETKKFISGVNSYLGLMKHYDTFKLREKTARSFDEEIFKSIVFSEKFEKAIVAAR
jgi:hypothetical protein